MYEIFYQLLNDDYPTEVKFDREIDMKSYYNIWIAADDYHFCQFYYRCYEYTPAWME